MSNQFTPGPWHAREWNCRAATSVGRVADNLLGFELIAECSGNGRQVSSEQEEADARLIAAAPDLLEALQNALSFISCNAHLTHPKVEAHPIELRLRAAISKATGES